MSIHQSLKVSSKLLRTRNVLTRSERLERLTELGKWDNAKDSVFHLQKTRVLLGKKIGKKKKKKEEEAPAEGTAAAPAAGTAPAPVAPPGKSAATPAKSPVAKTAEKTDKKK